MKNIKPNYFMKNKRQGSPELFYEEYQAELFYEEQTAGKSFF